MSAVKVNKIGPNPLDWALQQIGMTRKDFGIEIGFGKTYLLRVSQGRYSNLTTHVQSKLYKMAEAKGIDLDEEILGLFGPSTNLDEAYDWWVVQHRIAQVLPDPAKNVSLNPFQRLVTAAGGVARMSALLAAPDSLVERYAKGETYRMPMPIMIALSDVGYDHINHLDSAMQAWGAKNVQSN